MDVQNIGGAPNRGVQQGSTSVSGSINADQVIPNQPSARENQVTLSTTSPSDAQKILNQQIQQALSKVQETTTPSKLSTLDTNSGAPSQIAGQTLSTIQRGLAKVSKEADSEEKIDFLNEAVQGVQDAFTQAREVLANVSTQGDEVRTNVDTTETLVQRGIENIRNELSSDSKPANGTPAEQLVS